MKVRFPCHTGYATDFHYQLGGMLHAVHHTNGV